MKKTKLFDNELTCGRVYMDGRWTVIAIKGNQAITLLKSGDSRIRGRSTRLRIIGERADK